MIKNNKFEIVALGTASRDLTFENLLGQQLDWGSKNDAKGVVFGLGGGAANCAITFARFGLKTAIVSKVGKDKSGEEVKKTLKAEGVSLLIKEDQKLPTAVSAVILNDRGERIVATFRGASDDFKRADVAPAAWSADWWYIVPGNIPPRALLPLLGEAVKRGIKLAVNPSASYLELPAFRKFTRNLEILLVNKEEALRLTNLPASLPIQEVLKKMEAKINVVTDGPRGSFAREGYVFYEVGTFREKKITDRTGAGDAFGSAFTASLVKGLGVEEALRRASANATSMVETVGAQTGILYAKDFSGKRFRNLKTKVSKL